MSKILGIDYGIKLTGLAITDSNKLIASGLDIIKTKKLIYYLDNLFLKENIIQIVIGLPKKFNNQEFPIEFYIQKFINKINYIYPKIGIIRIDERFTSKMALDAMINNKFKKKEIRNKSLINIMSAIIILQSFLDQKKIYDSSYINL